MPRGIIKIKDRYFEWSTIVDAPTSRGMTIDELKSYLRDSVSNPPEERLKRLEETGTSFKDSTLEFVVSGNRAGRNRNIF